MENNSYRTPNNERHISREVSINLQNTVSKTQTRDLKYMLLKYADITVLVSFRIEFLYRLEWL